jgi:hypothetical protein
MIPCRRTTVWQYEIMALAGADHVVVAVQAQLGWTPGAMGNQCSKQGPLRGLGFLAAECTAHAPHFNGHRVGRAAEHVRGKMLQF